MNYRDTPKGKTQLAMATIAGLFTKQIPIYFDRPY